MVLIMKAGKNAINYIERLSFWGRLTEDEKELVSQNAFLQSYQEGGIVHAKESECLGLIQIVSGNVRTYMVSYEGREITLYRLQKGNIDVLSAACIINQITFDTQMTAGKNCSILVIPAQILSGLKKSNIYVRCFIYETLSNRFSDVMWMIQQTMFLGIDQRLARYLIQEYESLGKMEIHKTHEQIAMEINSVREVVARMTRNFVSDGLIETGRGVTRILDLESLRRLAYVP